MIFSSCEHQLTMEALTVRAPWVDDGAMSRTKSIRKQSVEMREAQLEKERRTAPQRARLKVETTLAVAAFNVRQLIEPFCYLAKRGSRLDMISSASVAIRRTI